MKTLISIAMVINLVAAPSLIYAGIKFNNVATALNGVTFLLFGAIACPLMLWFVDSKRK